MTTIGVRDNLGILRPARTVDSVCIVREGIMLLGFPPVCQSEPPVPSPDGQLLHNDMPNGCPEPVRLRPVSRTLPRRWTRFRLPAGRDCGREAPPLLPAMKHPAVFRHRLRCTSPSTRDSKGLRSREPRGSRQIARGASWHVPLHMLHLFGSSAPAWSAAAFSPEGGSTTP
jgi:hypothetical protein